jgi:phytol kinase
MIENPYIAIVLVLILTSGLMGAIRIFQKRHAPHPEWCRKLMHIGSGIVALGMPWLFQSTQPVLLLCAISLAGLVAMKHLKYLKQNIGRVVGEVKRESSGDIYFPLTIAILFLLTKGDPLFYCIPIMILTFADAAAALVGIFYGVLHFETPGGRKTIEGSLAFFLVAFFCAYIPMLFFTDFGSKEILLMAFLLAFLLMIVEAAVGWKGLDNLLIPVIGFLVLKVTSNCSLAELISQAVITLSLSISLFLMRFRARFSNGAPL